MYQKNNCSNTAVTIEAYPRADPGFLGGGGGSGCTQRAPDDVTVQARIALERGELTVFGTFRTDKQNEQGGRVNFRPPPHLRLIYVLPG